MKQTISHTSRATRFPQKTKLASLVSAAVMSLCTITATAAESKNVGKLYGDFRLRFESVEQNNALQDAEALTLRSRIGYKTASANGFSGLIEIEDSRAIIDDYSVPPSDFNRGVYSVIADPESNTEIDQAFVQYKAAGISSKLGRQVITLDNHRFVGHVGWRQDRQTFDALSVNYAPTKAWGLKYAYLDKRNRIFSDDADIESKDHLLNASYKTGAGKLTAYAYLLEVDNGSENGLDTYGLRYSGKSKSGSNTFLYSAEYASQESSSGDNEFDADYIALEGGLKFNGVVAKIGYEKLGSDEGEFGFSTPLATLHKFNGWSDQFLGTPNQGLEDVYAVLTGKVAGGKWLIAYHDFTSDEALEGSDDLGSELNLLYAKKFAKRYNAGIKYAQYDAGSSAFYKVDTDKLWLWVGAKF